MKVKQHKGVTFQLLYKEQQLKKRVKEIAVDLNKFYADKKDIVAICVLNGAFVFFTDLVRELEESTETYFIRLSSYQGMESKGQVKIETGLKESMLRDRHILLIEDICDSGKTLQFLINKIREFEPASLKTAVLIKREDKENTQGITIDHVGFICEAFVIGYGLDYDQWGRNFPDIYQKSLE